MIKGGINYRIITDHLGSVRFVIDSNSGIIAQELRYDEFGVILTDSNPGFQPFGFAGGLTDNDTLLVRFGARDYNPQTGRWTAKDRLGLGGGDTNFYNYVFNNPLNLIDSTREDAELIGIITIGGFPHVVIRVDNPGGGSYFFDFFPDDGRSGSPDGRSTYGYGRELSHLDPSFRVINRQSFKTKDSDADLKIANDARALIGEAALGNLLYNVNDNVMKNSNEGSNKKNGDNNELDKNGSGKKSSNCLGFAKEACGEVCGN
ncbi:MAG: RHS repeat-associated core domain-containing protein [Halobacteriovoraceae bacterium]|nr:RHS repeat-associated core domain-containing protein [Halobacteriovoraceae bacterium]